MSKSGSECGSFPLVSLVKEAANGVLAEVLEIRSRAVGGAIVDDDDFLLQGDCRREPDAVEDLLDGLPLVEYRDHDRECVHLVVLASCGVLNIGAVCIVSTARPSRRGPCLLDHAWSTQPRW